MAIDTDFDLSIGSFMACFLPFLFFFLGFLAFLVDIGIVGLILLSFIDLLGVNIGGTDFFSTFGIR